MSVREYVLEVDVAQAIADAVSEELSKRLGKRVLLVEPRLEGFRRRLSFNVVDENDTVVGTARVEVKGSRAKAALRLSAPSTTS
ncbi:hypothetical protein IG193_08540 [Infirmifilum lucidum]|uniref:Uncharacterized protein n=1 Tax=Infirmifilum lucidum TaxID=2776706 RepID=A0A7L9FG56_9CREN|nr:hypothetical protein [Infirmifilum lucidum]QOJ78780.1 hypothetical protein IG193_08540 [Infirmifilum lucidum]